MSVMALNERKRRRGNEVTKRVRRRDENKKERKKEWQRSGHVACAEVGGACEERREKTRRQNSQFAVSLNVQGARDELEEHRSIVLTTCHPRGHMFTPNNATPGSNQRLDE
jgi:hypothetical protein